MNITRATAKSSLSTPANSGVRTSCPSDLARPIGRGVRRIGLRSRTPKRQRSRARRRRIGGGDGSAWRDRPVAQNDRALPHVAIFAVGTVAIRQSDLGPFGIYMWAVVI